MKDTNGSLNSFILLSSPHMHDLGDEIAAEVWARHNVLMLHHKMELTTFANGEILPKIPDTIRGLHVFFLHALQHPDPNSAMMTMFIANDAMKRASVAGITVVIPFIGYMRQDRKDKPRVPITARMVADLIESNHMVKAVMTMDLHAEQEEGFFKLPVDNLKGWKVFSDHIREKFGDDLSDVAAIAADFGGAVRNHRLSEALGGIPVGILQKRHKSGTNETSHEMQLIGESVAGKRVIVFEDMIDTGGTAISVLDIIKGMGAKEVYLYGTHGIFSRGAENRFAEKNISVVTTDSIPRKSDYYAAHPWLTKVSIVPYLAGAIHEATQAGGSISKLAH